jgi:uncharacterized protein YcaQ
MDLPEYYTLAELPEWTSAMRYRNEIKILNPFDNAVIQRKRLEQLFEFEYQFECYLPAGKRRFGYFSLPLLFRDRFIGLLDCKAHRGSGHLEIKHLHRFDDGIVPDFHDLLKTALIDFAEFNGCAQPEFPL